MRNVPIHAVTRERASARFRGRCASALVAGVASILLFACSPDAAGEQQQAGAPAAGAGLTLTPEQRRHITLVTVAPATFRKTIETTGVVDFDNDQATSVLAPFSGPVSRLLVSVGARVKKGQVLAEVASPDFATAISTYRKAIATAQTARRLADLDRDAALQTLVSLDVDPKAIAAIQQGRPVPRIQGLIRASIPGTIVERLITPGQLLQASTTPCFTIADLSRVWVMAQIFDADVAAIAIGDTADIVSGGGLPTLVGTVDNIAAQVDPNTRSVTVRVTVANPGERLKKQMYVRVRIHPNQPSTGLLVPDSAILRDDENLPFVYVARSDNSFVREHVTLGYRDGNRYEITQGLKAGDRIVVEGGIFVQFMESQ